MKLTTPKFRVSYPNLHEAKQVLGQGKAKYSMVMIFDTVEINKDPEQKALWDAMLASVDTVADEKFGNIPPKLKRPFKNGEDKTDDDGAYLPGFFEGSVYINASSLSKPFVVDQNVDTILEASGFPSGCYAQAKVNPYGWQHPANGKGVSFGLGNVQMIAPGESLGGGGQSKPQDDFQVIDTPDASQVSNSSIFGGE